MGVSHSTVQFSGGDIVWQCMLCHVCRGVSSSPRRCRIPLTWPVLEQVSPSLLRSIYQSTATPTFICNTTQRHTRISATHLQWKRAVVTIEGAVVTGEHAVVTGEGAVVSMWW